MAEMTPEEAKEINLKIAGILGIPGYLAHDSIYKPVEYPHITIHESRLLLNYGNKPSDEFDPCTNLLQVCMQ